MALSQVSPQLIEACRIGDRGSIETLLEQISPDLYRILFSMLRDHDDTDEVLQETLTRLFRYIGALKDIDRFPAWAMRIAVNQVQTFRVRKNRTRLYDLEDHAEVSDQTIVTGGRSPENPRDRAIRDQVKQEIAEAMESLPNRQRMATVLFEVEGFSIKEIAHSLECSEGAVKFNIHEGRKKLRRRLLHLVREMRWGRRRIDEQNQVPETQTSDEASTGA